MSAQGTWELGNLGTWELGNLGGRRRWILFSNFCVFTNTVFCFIYLFFFKVTLFFNYIICSLWIIETNNKILFFFILSLPISVRMTEIDLRSYQPTVRNNQPNIYLGGEKKKNNLIKKLISAQRSWFLAAPLPFFFETMDELSLFFFNFLSFYNFIFTVFIFLFKEK